MQHNPTSLSHVIALTAGAVYHFAVLVAFVTVLT
jgi:hypothetical protein